MRYEIIVIEHTGSLESDGVFSIGDKNYLCGLADSNVGNRPKTFQKVKDLAKAIIEIEDIKDFPLRIKIDNSRNYCGYKK